MAEFGSRQARRGLDAPRRWSYTPQQIADALIPRRDRLVDQVPIELAAARGLTRDQREFAVDEAIDYLVTEYRKPLNDPDSLERVFWKATSIRIKRIREGRETTVRGGWRRVDLEDADLPTLDADPEQVVIHRSEQALMLEFSATLTDGERRVLICQYGGSKRKRGRVVLARQLGMAIGEVRTHERNIKRKLERFSAILAAGTQRTPRFPWTPRPAATGCSTTRLRRSDHRPLGELHRHRIERAVRCPAASRTPPRSPIRRNDSPRASLRPS